LETFPVSDPNADSLRSDKAVGSCFQIGGTNILPETGQQRHGNIMLDDGIRNKYRKLAAPHQIGQQQSVFTANRARIKEARVHIDSGASKGETSRIQIPNAAIGL
jgi:hypothetical protein